MKNKTAIDFLLFCVAGVDSEDSLDSLINGAVDRAYRDAASRVLRFKPNKGKVVDEFKRNKRKSATDCLHERILELIDNNGANFWEWHRSVRRELIAIYDESSDSIDNVSAKFTQGIAQKWINMSLKYLLVFLRSLQMIYGEDGLCSRKQRALTMLENLDSVNDRLDVPIDSYILSAVKCGEIRSWSTIEDEQIYEEYQKTLKNGRNKEGSLLDWENKTWINKVQEVRK